MRIIRSTIPILQKICKQQPEKEYAAYRFTHHQLTVPCDEGMLLYHTLTGELLCLSTEEWNSIWSDHALRLELIRHWYLVPQEYDEQKRADQLLRLIRMLDKPKGGVTHYTVFTTTDCNARCFYCYELGRPRRNMSEQTAHAAAAYIARGSKGGLVTFQWFGGEPLLNMTAIDVITDDLQRLGIPFKSNMVSNGYLFDMELVAKAKEKWKLQWIQITLDGTEAVHNAAKSFIYSDKSPYIRIMRNIDLLLDAAIEVTIRLNMNRENAEDLSRLIESLAARFGTKKGLTVYIGLLTDFLGTGSSVAQDDSTIEAYRALTEKTRKYGLNHEALKDSISINGCMADNDSSLSILPDGHLGKCEHESEEKLVGSIYSDELNNEMLSEWKERVFSSKCKNCVHYPQCRRLKLCAWEANGCTEVRRMQSTILLQNEIVNTYMAEKAKKHLCEA